ncbi:hypothetical protein GCM10027440_15040 [Nocardiopsis coralliicola]
MSAGRVAGDKCQEIGHCNGGPCKPGPSKHDPPPCGPCTQDPIPYRADLRKHEVTQRRGVRFPRTRLFRDPIGEKARSVVSRCPIVGGLRRERFHHPAKRNAPRSCAWAPRSDTRGPPAPLPGWARDVATQSETGPVNGARDGHASRVFRASALEKVGFVAPMGCYQRFANTCPCRVRLPPTLQPL